MILELSWQVFEKSSDIKFNENPSSGSRGVPYGKTDRHNEGNSRFSQIRENAYQACVPSAPATSLVMFPLGLSTAAVSYKESDGRWVYIFEILNILTDIHYRYTLISTGNNNIILRTQLPY